MHGGADGVGAPYGNKNAVKHGLYTREALQERRGARELVKEVHVFLRSIGEP